MIFGVKMVGRKGIYYSLVKRQKGDVFKDNE
jgi:hypothetical protein